MALKLPTSTLAGGKRDSGGAAAAAPAVAAAASAAPEVGTSQAGQPPRGAKPAAAGAGQGFKPMPLLGKWSIAAQYGVLGMVLLALLAVASVIVVIDTRVATYGTIYVSTAAEMRMLSQRVAKAAQTGLAGSAPALRQLQESREQFAAALQLLTIGGQSGDTALPPTSDAVMPVLEQLVREWEKVDRNVLQVLAQTRNLVGLGTSVRSINASSLADLAEEIQASGIQSNGSARDIAVTGQMVMLSQRLAKNANAILVSDSIDPSVAAVMERDAATFAELLRLLQNPALARSPAANIAFIPKLDALQKNFGEFQTAVNAIIGNLQALANAKQAGRRVMDDSEPLLNTTRTLSQAYERELAGRNSDFIALVNKLKQYDKRVFVLGRRVSTWSN